jgi:hypothetical protein
MMLFKVREKFSVGQVLESRSLVGHDVDLPWEEACLQAAAVVALVGAGEVAQSGGWSFRGDGPFVHT